MSTFTVTPDSLIALAEALYKTEQQMEHMKTTASGYDGRLGGSDLEGEIGGFCDHWNYGIGQLKDHMGTVIQRLMQASAAYAQAEQAAATAAQQQAADGRGMPGGPR